MCCVPQDNFFSTDKQGTNRKGIERFNRLQAVVSTLSTGPVFPSDAVGDSDVALILRSCDAGGRVLRPDRAATSMDKNILDKALALGLAMSNGIGRDVGSDKVSGSDANPGELEYTTSTVAGITTYIVLAANTSIKYTVSLAELGAYGATDYVAFEANSSNIITRLTSGTDGQNSLVMPTTDRWSFNLWTVVPVLSGGYAFLGEASSKWVALSRQRYVQFKLSRSNLSFLWLAHKLQMPYSQWPTP